MLRNRIAPLNCSGSAARVGATSVRPRASATMLQVTTTALRVALHSVPRLTSVALPLRGNTVQVVLCICVLVGESGCALPEYEALHQNQYRYMTPKTVTFLSTECLVSRTQLRALRVRVVSSAHAGLHVRTLYTSHACVLYRLSETVAATDAS